MTLAPMVGATVWSESEVEGLPSEDLTQLTQIDKNSWSAFTLRIGANHLVVYNSAQSPPRINSVIMHELAHITLGHELHDAHLSEGGHLVPSNYNQDQEHEADWLGGTLLLPRPALVKIKLKGMDDLQAMQHYQASEEMLTWRIRMTGVDYQMAYLKKAVGQSK